MRIHEISSLALLAPLLSTLAVAQSGYVIDSDLRALYSIDLATANVTLIGSTGNSGINAHNGLAWRSDLNELWAIDFAGGGLGPLDLATGTFTPLLQTGTSGWQAVAWDESRALFVLANQDGRRYLLNPSTGAMTLLGTSFTDNLTALDFDPAGVLWAISSQGRVSRINTTSGAITFVFFTAPWIQGFAIDAAGDWYGATTTTDSLYRIDSTTGAVTLVGVMPGLDAVKGLEIQPTGTNLPIGTNGCTTNPNSTGASGRIDAFGSRTVFINDVTLVASALPASSFLFFLTSTTEAQINGPGGSLGNLCLGGNIGRYVGPGQILSSGTSGAASLRLNLAATPTPTGFVAVVAGERRSYQAWHRDVSGGAAASNFTDRTTVVFE